MAPDLRSHKITVFLIVLLDVMGLGLIIPSQPFLAQLFGATPTLITWLGMTYALMQFVFSPVWGGLSDRYGRRPILFITLTLTMIGHLAFSVAASLPVLFLARALAGLGAANISTAQAVISDVSPSRDRSSSMAILGAAFGLGFIFGPAIGGVLTQYFNSSAPAIFAAALSAFNLLFVFLRLPETRVPSTPTTRHHSHLRGVGEIASLPAQQRNLIACTFLMVSAFALMEQSVGLFIQSVWVLITDVHGSHTARLNASSALNTRFLVVVGISAVFVQGFLVRRLFKKFDEPPVMSAGLAVLVIALLAIPVLGAVGSFPLFLSSGALLALGSGLFNPALTGLLSRTTDENQQGMTLALNQSAAALGRIVGPLCAGYLFSLNTNAPFVVAATVTLFALFCVKLSTPARP